MLLLPFCLVNLNLTLVQKDLPCNLTKKTKYCMWVDVVSWLQHIATHLNLVIINFLHMQCPSEGITQDHSDIAIHKLY